MADLIDRQALMQDIAESVVFTGRPDMPSAELRGANKIIDRIKAASAVDAVEVVHGYNTGRARWFECSVCGYGFNDIFLLDESDDMMEPKYCAHCGAKMDGKRREENEIDRC